MTSSLGLKAACLESTDDWASGKKDRSMLETQELRAIDSVLEPMRRQVALSPLTAGLPALRAETQH